MISVLQFYCFIVVLFACHILYRSRHAGQALLVHNGTVERIPETNGVFLIKCLVLDWEANILRSHLFKSRNKRMLSTTYSTN